MGITTITLRRRARAILPLAGLLLAGAGLTACGGGKSEEDVEALLDRGFEQSIPSADLKIDGELEIEGLPGLEGPIRIHAEGPYVRGEDDELPRMDLDIDLGSREAGQNVRLGFLSTGERVFVNFGGTYYEQSRESVARANEELRSEQDGKAEGSLKELGLDPRTWVVDAEGQGQEKAAGVETEHVSGRLDVEALFRDLNKLVNRSADAIGGADPDAPAPLSDRELAQLAEVVGNPEFDVYVGKDDDVIHRLSTRLEVKVPEDSRDGVAGITGGSLRLSVELANVGGDQAVTAPRDSRPLSDLTKQLGGLGALGGAGEQPEGPPGDRAVPQGGDAGPGVDEFERYSECIDQAPPDATEALERCSALLR